MVHYYQQKVERRLMSRDQVNVQPYMLCTDLANNVLKMCRSAHVIAADEKEANCFRVHNSRMANLRSQVQVCIPDSTFHQFFLQNFEFFLSATYTTAAASLCSKCPFVIIAIGYVVYFMLNR